jgi:hypothetical protein
MITFKIKITYNEKMSINNVCRKYINFLNICNSFLKKQMNKINKEIKFICAVLFI